MIKGNSNNIKIIDDIKIKREELINFFPEIIIIYINKII
jgi:hypothetical protein